MRVVEKSHKEFESGNSDIDTILFDRLNLKLKVTIDSIRNIQKYAQVLLETSIVNLNKDHGEINKTVQSVIKYLSPMKKFNKVTFETEFNTVPACNYDSGQIQHLIVHLFTNATEARADATIRVKTYATGR